MPTAVVVAGLSVPDVNNSADDHLAAFHSHGLGFAIVVLLFGGLQSRVTVRHDQAEATANRDCEPRPLLRPCPRMSWTPVSTPTTTLTYSNRMGLISSTAKREEFADTGARLAPENDLHTVDSQAYVACLVGIHLSLVGGA